MFSSWWPSSDANPKENDAEKKDDSETTGESEAENSTAENTQEDNENLSNDVAKNMGKFLFSMASAATKTASYVKDSLKETVDTKTFMGDFNKEQEKFITEKHNKRSESAVPPWVGYNEEETMKNQILALSTDERNFLRDPPTGAEFYYDYDVMFPVAVATLSEDKELQKMRFLLVPKKVSEERFWRNYFYRVSLIKQSSQLTSLAASTGNGLGADSSNKKTQEDDKSNDVKTSENTKPKIRQTDNILMDDIPENLAESPLQTEFISDTFAENQELSHEDLRQIGMDRLQIDEEKEKTNNTERVDTQADTNPSNTDQKEDDKIPDWEKELQEELQDYEVVPGETETDPAWEKEIEDMLEAEVGDLDVS